MCPWLAANKKEATHHKFTCTPSGGNPHKIITLFAEAYKLIENQDKQHKTNNQSKTKHKQTNEQTPKNILTQIHKTSHGERV